MHPEAWTSGPAHSGQTRNDEVETADESVVRVLPIKPGNMAALTFGSSVQHTEQNPKVKAEDLRRDQEQGAGLVPFLRVKRFEPAESGANAVTSGSEVSGTVCAISW